MLTPRLPSISPRREQSQEQYRTPQRPTTTTVGSRSAPSVNTSRHRYNARDGIIAKPPSALSNGSPNKDDHSPSPFAGRAIVSSPTLIELTSMTSMQEVDTVLMSDEGDALKHSAALMNLAESVVDATPQTRKSLRRSLARHSFSQEELAAKFHKDANNESSSNNSFSCQASSRANSLSVSFANNSTKQTGRSKRRQAQREKALSFMVEKDFPEGQRRNWYDPHMGKMREWHLNADVDNIGESEASRNQYLADLMLEMQHTENLQYLTLSKFPLGNSKAKMSAFCYNGLGQTPSMLSTLCLTQCNLGPVAFLTLCEFLSTTQNQRGLITLDVSHNKLDFHCIEYLSLCLRSTNIMNINLHANPLGVKAISPLVDLLQECSRIQSLDVGFCNFESDRMSAFFVAISKASSLIKLNLDAIGLSNSGAMSLLRYIDESKTLQDISLKFNEPCTLRVYKERLERILQRNRRLQYGRGLSMFAMTASSAGGGGSNVLDATSIQRGFSGLWGSSSVRSNSPEDEDDAEKARRKGGLTEGYAKYTSNDPSLHSTKHPRGDGPAHSRGKVGTGSFGATRARRTFSEVSSTADSSIVM